MVTAFSRGHQTYLGEDGLWRFVDNNLIDDFTRACKKCGLPPTKDGHDACLGVINNVSSACCGHGVTAPILIPCP